MQRLDDAEFGRRQRERNLRANQNRRERLNAAGYTQWNLWIAGKVRNLAEKLAVERNQSPAELVATLIESAARPALALPDPLPLFTESPAPAPVDQEVDRNSRILELKRTQEATG